MAFNCFLSQKCIKVIVLLSRRIIRYCDGRIIVTQGTVNNIWLRTEIWQGINNHSPQISSKSTWAIYAPIISICLASLLTSCLLQLSRTVDWISCCQSFNSAFYFQSSYKDVCSISFAMFILLKKLQDKKLE